MNLIFLLVFLSSPQFVTGNILATSSMPPKMIPISGKIDFGISGKSPISQKVLIKDGATPKEALKNFVRVEEGFVCCDKSEVKAIDGVSADPMKNRWWILKINGSRKGASPMKTHLKAGDSMEWDFIEDAQ